MEMYKTFQMGTLVYAYYLDRNDEEQMQKDLDLVKSYVPLVSQMKITEQLI